MTLLNTDLIDLPVTTKDYHIYDVDKLPVVFLGIRVKNKFDENRIQIKNKYNPRLVTHFKLGYKDLEPTYLYGVQVNVKAEYKQLIDQLNYTHLPLSREDYSDMLSEYNLTCNDCYIYLCDGIYPLDIKHLDTISRKNMSSEIDSGFKSMVRKTDAPWYASLLNFNLFILGKSTGYGLDYSLSH